MTPLRYHVRSVEPGHAGLALGVGQRHPGVSGVGAKGGELRLEVELSAPLAHQVSEFDDLLSDFLGDFLVWHGAHDRQGVDRGQAWWSNGFMFERFTDRARRVLVLAQDEATALNHSFLGTEHVLLGLLAEGQGVAAKVLVELGADLEAMRTRVVETVAAGAPGSVTGPQPFTPRAKRVLELSLREALDLGHNYIGTEHIILGLIKEGEGVGAEVLRQSGFQAADVRAKVIELLAGYTPAPRPVSATPPAAPAKATTPAVNLLRTRAVARAGAEPLGSHHFLAALLEDPNCLAARVLESLGVTRTAVEVRVAELGTAGSTDAMPDPPGPAVFPLGAGMALTIGDDDLAAQAKAWFGTGDRTPAQLVEWLRQRLEQEPPPTPPAP